MVVDRPEMSVLIEVLDSARSGLGSALHVVGEAGVGKTTLIGAALATVADCTVLRATGVRAESHIAFAGLGALLRPLETLMPRLPREQAQAVAVAFGQVARVPASELVLGAACLRLIALAAEQSPVVLLVDDIQWFDEESWRAVAFAVRRISGEPIAAILAGRPCGHRVDGLPTLLINGLDFEAATVMLQGACPDLATDVCRQLHRRTGGNTLALVEAAQGLDPAQRRGAQELPEDLPTSQDLTTFFSSRAATCSTDTRRLLLLSALEGRGDLGILSVAAQRQGLDLALLGPAEQAGLITVGAQGLTFRHPLVQEAVLHSATPAQRRAAHSALAGALAPDHRRAAWHAAAACVGPDTRISDTLAGVAARADAAGAATSASIAFERASTLTPDAHLRAYRLLLAAEAAFAAGATMRAITLAADVPLDLLADPDQGRPSLVRGRAVMLLGRTGEAGPLLLDAARTLDPPTAAAALAEAVDNAIEGGDLEFARLVVARAEALTSQAHHPLLTFHIRRARSAFLAFSGDRAASVHLLRGAIDALNDSGAVSDDPTTWLALAEATSDVGDVIEGRRLFATAAAHARTRGDLPHLVDALGGQAFAERMMGQWAAAYATGTRVLELLDEDRSAYQLARVQRNLAEIDAARGNEALCRQRCQQTRSLAATHGFQLLTLLTDRTEALLDLGLNHLDAAQSRLRGVHRLQQQLDLPHPFFSPIPDLVEVCVRLGSLHDVDELIEEFESQTDAAAYSQSLERLIVDPQSQGSRLLRRLGIEDPGTLEAVPASGRQRSGSGSGTRAAAVRVEVSVPVLADTIWATVADSIRRPEWDEDAGAVRTIDDRTFTVTPRLVVELAGEGKAGRLANTVATYRVIDQTPGSFVEWEISYPRRDDQEPYLERETIAVTPTDSGARITLTASNSRSRGHLLRRLMDWRARDELRVRAQALAQVS